MFLKLYTVIMKDELTMFCHQSPPLFSAALGLPPHGHASQPRPVQGWTCRPLPGPLWRGDGAQQRLKWSRG